MLDIIFQWDIALAAILIVVGMLILVGGAEILLRGASQLAVVLKIPPLIVGLTVVAFSNNAPEVALSISAVMKESTDFAIGIVVGSNICNVGLILGIAAILSPVAVCSSLIRREIPLMIAVSILILPLAILGAILGSAMPMSALFGGQFEGVIFPWMGCLLLTMLLAYVAWTIYELRYHKENNEVYARELEENLVPTEKQTNGKQTNGNHADGNHAECNKQSGEKKFWKSVLTNLAVIAAGVGILVVGSELMVQGSVQFARGMGVSELFIGLTVLAVGTASPELIVVIVAAIRRKSDIAIGNIIGSNIFNVLGVLGITALFSGNSATGGLQVSSQALLFDIPIMILLSLFCIVICITGRQVTRGEGVFLLLCYVAYIAALCMTAVYPPPPAGYM